MDDTKLLKTCPNSCPIGCPEIVANHLTHRKVAQIDHKRSWTELDAFKLKSPKMAKIPRAYR
jgi:hypothetical protein